MNGARRVGFFLYLAFGASLAGAYALAETSRLFRPRAVLHATVYPSVRTPPGVSGGGGTGGGGSGSFWHSGSHGGK